MDLRNPTLSIKELLQPFAYRPPVGEISQIGESEKTGYKENMSLHDAASNPAQLAGLFDYLTVWIDGWPYPESKALLITRGRLYLD